jgi:hypothetical protein
MKKSDVTSPNATPATAGSNSFPKRGRRANSVVWEVFDGSTDVAMRLTINPY